MIKSWSEYKSATSFGNSFIISFSCLVLVMLQVIFMFFIQNEELLWQGICSSGQLHATSNVDLVMNVSCPTQEPFIINTPSVIASVANNNNKIFCERTKGSIMRNEEWICVISKGNEK